LANSPLQEVIFEVKWELDFDIHTNTFVDNYYQFALGKFQQLNSNQFPVVKPKFPIEIPFQVLNYQTVFQFWNQEKKWPVLQLGPGILTVNDTEANYEWETVYFPLIKLALGNLEKAYDNELKYIEFSLRYIDVVKVGDYGFSDWGSFFEKNINFMFQNNFNTRGDIESFKLDQSFNLGENGVLKISFSNGKSDKMDEIFIWQTEVSCKKVIDKKGLLEWVNFAHGETSSIFKEICKKEFYASFRHK
jgi:uncharacterized protein (TIGR04255 family)